MASLEDKLPLSGSQLATLDDEAVQDLDQFVLRFGRLQDAIGARLLPAVLRVLQEPYCSVCHRLFRIGTTVGINRCIL